MRAALAKVGATRKVRVRMTSFVVAVHLACGTDRALSTGLTFAAAGSREIPAEIVRHLHIPLKLAIYSRGTSDRTSTPERCGRVGSPSA